MLYRPELLLTYFCVVGQAIRRNQCKISNIKVTAKLEAYLNIRVYSRNSTVRRSLFALASRVAYEMERFSK